MMNLLITAVLLNVYAESRPACPPPPPLTHLRTIYQPKGISYFQRVSPATREVSFVTADSNSPNRIINVDDPAKTIAVNGRVDPVLSPDGKLLTIPQPIYFDGKTGQPFTVPKGVTPLIDFTKSYDGDELFDVKNGSPATINLAEAKRQGKKIEVGVGMAYYSRGPDGQPKLRYVDDVQSLYQSVATVRQSGESTIYRTLAETNHKGLVYRDVRLDHTSGRVEPVGDLRLVCGGNIEGSLPVMAPDGREFSYYDATNQTTRVMSIPDSGECKEISSIPALVGKPSFSPDGRKMAFHVDRGVPALLGTPDKPAPDSSLSLYVLDRKSNKLSLIATEKDANLYYPAFISNDELTYIRSTKGKSPKMSIEMLKLAPLDWTTCTGCDATDELRFASATLGGLFAAHCGTRTLGMETALAGLVGLSPEACRVFVNSLRQETFFTESSMLNPSTLIDEMDEVPKTKRPVTRNNNAAKPGLLRFTSRKAPSQVSRADLLGICDRLRIDTAAGAEGDAKVHQ